MYDRTVDALATCQRSKTISVRISASWSLANVADAIAKHSDGTPSIPRDASSLQPLACAAVEASKDHEKVRANGIRALGHLLKETNFTGHLPEYLSLLEIFWGSASSSVEWLDMAVECLQSSLEGGCPKVKWNACYATGSLASNPTLPLVTKPVMARLIGRLVHLINENPNFKVQMQAAAAMENVWEKATFGDTFYPAISAVGRRLHVLEDGSQETDATESDCSLIQPIVDALPNFKYLQGLKLQLESTLLHLMGLLDASFSESCIFPRPDVLYAWMKKKVDQATGTQGSQIIHLKIRLSAALLKLMEYESHMANWEALKCRLEG